MPCDVTITVPTGVATTEELMEVAEALKLPATRIDSTTVRLTITQRNVIFGQSPSGVVAKESVSQEELDILQQGVNFVRTKEELEEQGWSLESDPEFVGDVFETTWIKV